MPVNQQNKYTSVQCEIEGHYFVQNIYVQNSDFSITSDTHPFGKAHIHGNGNKCCYFYPPNITLKACAQRFRYALFAFIHT